MIMIQPTEAGRGDQAAQRQWVLVGRLNQDSELHCFPVQPLPFRVGRQTGLSLTLSRPTVSAVHAELYERDNNLYVRDLATTNGTYVNGQPISAEQPLNNADLVQFADVPFRVSCAVSDSRSHTRREDVGDRALALVQFDRLFRTKAIVPHIQPIVELQSGESIGYEVLARSRLFGLEGALAMFDTAEQLGLATELSQAIRLQAIEESSFLPSCPHLFLNTHPNEVSQMNLLAHCETLRRRAPSSQITLEIHEAAATNLDSMIALRSGLDELNIRLAFDDFGAGQGRLSEIAAVKPHYLKFDRSLVRNLDNCEESRRTLVARLVAMAKELGVAPLAEGIETEGEALTCIELGFRLGQGYYYGYPKPIVGSACRPPRKDTPS